VAEPETCSLLAQHRLISPGRCKRLITTIAVEPPLEGTSTNAKLELLPACWMAELPLTVLCHPSLRVHREKCVVN